MMRNQVGLFTAAMFAVLLIAPAHAQQQDYYLTNGDAQDMFIVRDGQLQAQVDTFSLGYPIAVGESVLLYHRDAIEGREYDLAGNPTGLTWVGPGGYSEILDGTTDGLQYNYMIMCCAGTNFVLRTDLLFENIEELFALGQGGLPEQGAGIVYDPVGDQFFISTFADEIYRVSLNGVLLDQFTIPGVSTSLCCLAYEQTTDTFWAAANGTNTLFQFDRNGNALDSIAVAGISSFGNIYGGGMQLQLADEPLPPALAVPVMNWQALLLLILGMVSIGCFTLVFRR